ncbi:EamA family transporter [Devosia sp.]|uniref:EamA family transporter n=1 Tax=Devosia sp. TaxID=1871048 RepID=UPI0032639E14
MSNNSALPPLAAFGGLISVQVGAAFAKGLFPLVGPEGVAALRVAISALLLALFLQPWKLRLTREQWPALIGYGLMLGLMNVLIYQAFAYIPLGVAISIEVTGPLVLALLGSRKRLDFAWIALAAVGLALLPLGSVTGGLDWRGVGFALTAGACWATYVTLGARVASGGMRSVSAGMVAAAVIVVPLGASRAGTELLSSQALSVGLLVAVMSSAVPYLLDIYALKRLPTKVFGVMMSASPAVSALAGFFVLHEALTLVQWLGIVAIAGACAGSALASGRGVIEEAVN